MNPFISILKYIWEQHQIVASARKTRGKLLLSKIELLNWKIYFTIMKIILGTALIKNDSGIYYAFKGAATDMRYFARSKFSRSLVYKKSFSLIWKLVFKVGYLFWQER